MTVGNKLKIKDGQKRFSENSSDSGCGNDYTALRSNGGTDTSRK